MARLARRLTGVLMATLASFFTRFICWGFFIAIDCFGDCLGNRLSTDLNLSIKQQLKITTIEIEPYVMIDRGVRNHSNHGGGGAAVAANYYGYIPDLLKELSTLIDFHYQLNIVPDEKYGEKVKSQTSKWNGMIGELQSATADIAAGPLYITEQRKREVDFTRPFMTVHATVLLRRPPPGAATPVKSAEDLANQSEIKFGTLSRGIIPRAFRRTNDTTLRSLWRVMQKPSAGLLTSTNKDGIERVRRDKYAFILPDVIADYVTRRKPCDLMSVGKFLMERGYALAFRRHSLYLSAFDRAIDTLNRTGKLEELRLRWWAGQNECSTLDATHYDSLKLTSSDDAAMTSLRTVLWSPLRFACLLFVVSLRELAVV